MLKTRESCRTVNRKTTNVLSQRTGQNTYKTRLKQERWQKPAFSRGGNFYAFRSVGFSVKPLRLNCPSFLDKALKTTT